MEQLYTVNEAARILRVAPRTIRRWIKAGRAPHVRTPTSGIRFRESDLNAILDERASKALSP